MVVQMSSDDVTIEVGDFIVHTKDRCFHDFFSICLSRKKRFLLYIDSYGKVNFLFKVIDRHLLQHDQQSKLSVIKANFKFAPFKR